jgi:hypothetical protein
MEHQRQKFYYKLCILVHGKLYCYMQRSIEFQIGQSISQDLSSPSPFLYVYKTQEMAINNEIAYTSKDFVNKLAVKTVIKLMCWGNFIETPRKLAFSNMCVVENIGFQKQENRFVRETSKMRNNKQRSVRREISPRGVKSIKENSPGRVYNSVVARKKSPVAQNYFSNLKSRGKVQELLRKMKEETEKLDQEVRDMENWNKILDLEELETVNSSDVGENSKV